MQPLPFVLSLFLLLLFTGSVSLTCVPDPSCNTRATCAEIPAVLPASDLKPTQKAKKIYLLENVENPQYTYDSLFKLHDHYKNYIHGASIIPLTLYLSPQFRIQTNLTIPKDIDGYQPSREELFNHYKTLGWKLYFVLRLEEACANPNEECPLLKKIYSTDPFEINRMIHGDIIDRMKFQKDKVDGLILDFNHPRIIDLRTEFLEPLVKTLKMQKFEAHYMIGTQVSAFCDEIDGVPSCCDSNKELDVNTLLYPLKIEDYNELQNLGINKFWFKSLLSTSVIKMEQLIDTLYGHNIFPNRLIFGIDPSNQFQCQTSSSTRQQASPRNLAQLFDVKGIPEVFIYNSGSCSMFGDDFQDLDRNFWESFILRWKSEYLQNPIKMYKADDCDPYRERHFYTTHCKLEDFVSYTMDPTKTSCLWALYSAKLDDGTPLKLLDGSDCPHREDYKISTKFTNDYWCCRYYSGEFYQRQVVPNLVVDFVPGLHLQTSLKTICEGGMTSEEKHSRFYSKPCTIKELEEAKKKNPKEAHKSKSIGWVLNSQNQPVLASLNSDISKFEFDEYTRAGLWCCLAFDNIKLNTKKHDEL